MINEVNMALTRAFKEAELARVQADQNFRDALLNHGIETMLSGNVDTGKAILRDYIKASVGFKTGFISKSLIRIFGSAGIPRTRNLFSVISRLQQHAGLTLHNNTQHP